ncbi:MAG TPA: molybdate ABC transporter permease subunit [Eggerthellaceae bacterium]|nr:molybdate ABC transporter permease subunit [Eggerthellaceae bacterium]
MVRAFGPAVPFALLLALVCACALLPGMARAATVVPQESDAAAGSGMDVGIVDFHRAQKGSAQLLPDGRDVGYRYITGNADNAVLVALSDAVVLYLAPDVAARLGVNVKDPADCAALAALFADSDARSANGGVPLSDIDAPVTVTTERIHEQGAFTFRFAVESEGRTYAGVSSPNAVPTVLFCDYGTLVPGHEARSVAEDGEADAGVLSFLARVDFSPLWVSARTALAAMLIVVVVGVLCAWLALRFRSRLKSVIDMLFLVPMVLPPSACGLVLVYVFGKNSPTGAWLVEHGVSIVSTWPAAVIAAAVVAAPFMYRAARGAFESVDADMLDAARTLGWSEARVFVRITVPLSAPSLAAGAALSFSRALGEFGATVFFAGNYAGVTQTIPLAIYYDWMAGDVASAWFWVVVDVLFMGVFLVFTNSRFSTGQAMGANRRVTAHGPASGGGG